MAPVSSNLGRCWHGYLVLKMTSEDYAAQTGFVFMLPHNPGNCLHTMGNAQDQVLGTEKF